MKIGVLVWRLDYSGGTERQAIELAIKLQELKHEVIVYTPFLNTTKCFPERIKKINNIKTAMIFLNIPTSFLYSLY